MAFFLGFDTAKLKYDVALINDLGIELWYGQVGNKTAELVTLLTRICAEHREETVTCVVESTGRYHYPLLEAATQLSLPCRVYNPIITKQQIRASIRGKKTDKTDALIIARLGLRGEGRLHVPEPYQTAKQYVRSAQKLTVLNGILTRHHEGMASVLKQVKDTTVNDRILDISAAIDQAKSDIYAALSASVHGTTYKLIQTIPGVGPYIAASLIGELQTMERFATARSLVAYAGLDPRIRQSGSTLNSAGHLTKRGSSYLRRSVFIAANVARQHDPYFKALYDKKRAEGKPYTVAVVAVSRKLLLVVRGVWLSGKPYDCNLAGKC